MKKILIIGFLLSLVGCAGPTTFDYVGCTVDCQDRGYDVGECLRNEQAFETDISIGACVAPGSNSCQNKGSCGCYCKIVSLASSTM